MAVIAKLLIRSVTTFGTGNLIELGCVCDNDLMAAYATSEEDKLFTRYSPWGEMKLCQPSGYALGEAPDEFGQGAAFYAVLLSRAEGPETADGAALTRTFVGSAYASCPAICHSLTDFGDGQAKRVEFRSGGPNQFFQGVDRLNWKMSVDNPGATDQMKPGAIYWIVLYPAAKFDRDQAIAAALGHN